LIRYPQYRSEAEDSQVFRGGKQIGLDRNRIQQGAKDKEEVAVNILDVLGNTR